MKVLYASDLDRTLIFSNRFIDEYPTKAKYSVIERSGDRLVSFMANSVFEKLNKISSNENVKFVPVTTRGTELYKRVDFGFEPEYAITANGGVILHNGKPMEEWDEYIKSRINFIEAMNLLTELESELESLASDVRIIDNCYLYFRVSQEMLFDQEVLYFMSKYADWEFVRQDNKCFAIPKHFSKQIALRWLWHKLGQPYIVASGDSQLDLPMLTLANKAVIPEHGVLVKDKYVESGTFATGGIESPLITLGIVEELVK